MPCIPPLCVFANFPSSSLSIYNDAFYFILNPQTIWSADNTFLYVDYYTFTYTWIYSQFNFKSNMRKCLPFIKHRSSGSEKHILWIFGLMINLKSESKFIIKDCSKVGKHSCSYTVFYIIIMLIGPNYKYGLSINVTPPVHGI